MFNAGDIAAGALNTAPEPVSQEAVTFLFRMLHGFYGNLLFSKFATGEVITEAGPEQGGDRGMVSARQVWAHRLKGFDAATIKAALRKCEVRYTEFAPSLPQFLDLCRACAPRDYVPPPVKVGMSGELRYKYAAELRESNRQHMQAARSAIMGSVIAGAGLDSLKLCIATAHADAGGDEAGELLRLDRMLAPVEAA